MGNDTPNPIYQRLSQALDASVSATNDPSIRDALHDLSDAQGDAAVRDWVLRHHVRLGLDPVWILTGVGQPPRPLKTDDGIATPVFATTSIDPRTGHWRPLIRERIGLPAALVSPGRFVIRMESRAMEPRLRLGAYLVVDESQTDLPAPPSGQEEQVTQGPVLAVEVPGEGLVVRLARLDAQRQRLVLTGLDPSCPPYSLSRHTEYRVVGRVVWVAQTL